jgi:hypothetical protein
MSLDLALHTVTLTGIVLILGAAGLVMLARLLRLVVEGRQADAARRLSGMRAALIRAAVGAAPLPVAAARWPRGLASLAVAQAVERADQGLARAIVAAAEPLQLRRHLTRRLRSASATRRAQAITTLGWLPGGSAALRRTLMRDPSIQNRALAARVLLARGEAPPVRVLARALRFQAARPGKGVRQALHDPLLMPDRALRHLASAPGARVWLRQQCRQALARRQVQGTLIGTGAPVGALGAVGAAV